MEIRFFIIVSLTLSLFLSNMYGQDIKERKSFKKGTILSSELCYLSDNNYSPSKEPYDTNIIGIFSGNTAPTKLSDLVITKGVAFVRFNSENGSIKKGDPVTSSSTQGEAMKATDSGMILGIALEDADIAESGLLKIRLSIQYLR